MAGLTILLALFLVLPATAAKRPKETIKPSAPDLLMDGGRRLSFERSFSLEREVKPKRSFWTRVVDAIAGQPDFHYLVSPYSVVTDSRGRIIVTDVAAAGIHIFDFEQQKYKFLSRRDTGKDPMLTPQCVAVDAQDNIYVTDSQVGKIFVFDAKGKYRRAIGSLKGGEGYFKRPTGIAIDSAAQRIYVTDTLRNKIFVMDMQGSVLQTIGKTGTGDGEFNYPTELRLNGSDLAVVDAMNFRVQVFDRSGTFRYAIGKPGDGAGWIFRPKGIGFDSESHLYVVDGAVGRSAGVRRARTAALLLRREGNWGRAISVADWPADRQSRSHLRRRFLQPARPGISILRNHAGGRREESNRETSARTGLCIRRRPEFRPGAYGRRAGNAQPFAWRAVRRCIRREAWDARFAMLRTAGSAATRRCGIRSCRRNLTCPTAAQPIRTRATRNLRWASPAACV